MQSHYDIRTLRDYLAGKLDVKAMHELEKAALEDPVLAEALEGLRAGMDMESAELDSADITSADLQDAMDRLNKRLDQFVSERMEQDSLPSDIEKAERAAEAAAPVMAMDAKKQKINRRRWWAAAAAVFFLLGTGLLYVRMQRDATTDNPVALIEKSQDKAPNDRRAPLSDSVIGLPAGSEVAQAVGQALADSERATGLAMTEKRADKVSEQQSESKTKVGDLSPAAAYSPKVDSVESSLAAAPVMAQQKLATPEATASSLISDSLLQKTATEATDLTSAIQGQLAGIAITRNNNRAMQRAARKSAAGTTNPVTGDGDSNALADVVIVGYGTRRKKANPLFGKSRKVNPVRIRGVAAVADSVFPDRNRQPLIVADGKVLKGSALQDLSPDSIANITILSPEKAPAIYGDRGMNGAILITTKKASRMAMTAGASVEGNDGKNNTGALLAEKLRQLDNKRRHFGDTALEKSSVHVKVSRLSGDLRPVIGFKAFKKSVADQLNRDLEKAVIHQIDKGTLSFELRLGANEVGDKSGNEGDIHHKALIFNVKSTDPRLADWFKAALITHADWNQWQSEDIGSDTGGQPGHHRDSTKIKLSWSN